LQSYNTLFVKHFFYSLVLERHHLIGLLTRVDLFYYVLYIAINIFCDIFRVSSIVDVGICVENLSFINVMFSYLAYHLSFISDMLDLSLRTYRIIYATIEIMSITLELIYIGIKIAKVSKLKLF